ncbi:MAG: hypothetical protein ABIQ73_11385 [Acidimicrobiales bacterium]
MAASDCIVQSALELVFHRDELHSVVAQFGIVYWLHSSNPDHRLSVVEADNESVIHATCGISRPKQTGASHRDIHQQRPPRFSPGI